MLIIIIIYQNILGQQQAQNTPKTMKIFVHSVLSMFSHISTSLARYKYAKKIKYLLHKITAILQNMNCQFSKDLFPFQNWDENIQVIWF